MFQKAKWSVKGNKPQLIVSYLVLAQALNVAPPLEGLSKIDEYIEEQGVEDNRGWDMSIQG